MNVSNRVSDRSKLITVTSLTIAALVTYLGSIFLLGESFLGFEFHARHQALITLGLIAVAIWACFVLSKYAQNYVSAATNLQVSILATVLLMIAGDVSYTFVQNVMKPASSTYGYARERDSNYLTGEYYPKTYFPTDKNFRLFKPGIAVTASSFGSFYSSEMLASPNLVSSTLERRTVSIVINEFGFREAGPIQDAKTFALGDSFTFGWGVNVDKSWVKRLESRLSTPIYNLGLYSASPKQELELLKFLVTKHRVTIQHLLWMIFEGNDLEENYDEMAPRQQPIPPFSSTVLEPLLKLPMTIKKQSVISKILNGEIQFRYATRGPNSSHQFVDGIALPYQRLFKSDRFGYKFFYEPHVDLVQKPMPYVRLHPNRPKLEKVFMEMGELAGKAGFDVTVILAPTPGRLQGKYFSDFPEASPRPHFLDFVAGLARKEKFEIINLYDTLLPLADRQLLYFRDDDHWNEEGNRLVANSLTEQLSKLFSQHTLGR
jgi:SGNH hydrolase-like domain, acetyltransferase AlgX